MLGRPESPPVAGLVPIRLLNDDKTSMEFVVGALETTFDMPRSVATESMHSVHRNESDVCDRYPAEIDAAHLAAVTALARHHDHPLQCTMEKE